MRAVALIAILICTALPARAQDLNARDHEAIRSAIQGQLAAFQRDDGNAAFALASPRIKTIFRDPDTFMRMVRADYEPVYRPQTFSFRGLETIEGNLVQPVLVVGPSGVAVTALYIMERQDDGTWLIGGCVLVAEPDKGA